MTTQDGSAKFKIKDMRTHHMCGEIVALVTTPPDYEHLILCDGQIISADDYPELVEALGSNVLPNLNGRVLQGGSTAGEYKEAGLPNITGTLKKIRELGEWHDSTGCLYTTTDTINNSYRWQFDTSTIVHNYPRIGFDASRSNPIYGASSTVQPPAYTVRYYICYG